jgi:hypothetical protein
MSLRSVSVLALVAQLALAACASDPPGLPPGGVTPASAENPFPSAEAFAAFKTFLQTSAPARADFIERCARDETPAYERAAMAGLMGVPEAMVEAEFCTRLVNAILGGRIGFAEFKSLGEGNDPHVIGRMMRIILDERGGGATI